ncbi:MAG: GNAT family N-acetyltransferase [Bacteroidota bacterium]
MRHILETERLQLRELTHADAAFIIDLLNSPGWLAFIGDRNVHNEAQAIGYMENGPIKSYAQNGYGLFMVMLKESQTPIGICGIINRDILAHPDIGFALLPEYAGQGYAFEMANATLKYAKETLNLPKILAIVLPNNPHSIRLLEKIGLKQEGVFVYPDSEEELLMYGG